MTSSGTTVDVMNQAGTAAVASEEGGYVQLDSSNACAEKKPSHLFIGASITAITMLLATLVSLPAFLLLRSPCSSTATPTPFTFHSTLSNSSQYGNYPMLYEDPSNHWTPAAGFLFNMTSTDIDLNKVPLAIYRGNITLVTNVASFWGLTPATYTFYTYLYDRYQSRGFTILAYPCNQFGNQEPYNNTWIKHFVEQYDVTFPMFNKTLVNEEEGGTVDPVFQFVKNAFPGELEWNFVKFFVDQNGAPLRRFSTPVSEFKEIEQFIVEMLNQRDALYNGTMTPIIPPSISTTSTNTQE